MSSETEEDDDQRPAGAGDESSGGGPPGGGDRDPDAVEHPQDLDIHPDDQTSVFDDLARQATRNPDSDIVVLGKTDEAGVQYVNEAKKQNPTYFQLG